MVLDQFCSGNSEQVEQLGIPWFYSTKEVIFLLHSQSPLSNIYTSNAIAFGLQIW